jgi:hypothetical protein
MSWSLSPASVSNGSAWTAPPEWIGAELTFDLKQEAGSTVVLFAQRGWKEPVDFMHYRSTKWATYLQPQISL